MSLFSPKTKCVWRISKLSPNSQKICVQTLFCLFYGLAARIFFLKKNCARIFLEFGESLERVWRFSKLILSLFFWRQNRIKEKAWKLTSSKHFPVSSKLFPNSYVQYFFFLEKERSELEYSPNSFETHLSLEHQHTKNIVCFLWSEVETFKVLLRVWSSLQTQMFSVCSCYFFFAHFSGGKGVSFKHQHTQKKTCVPRCPKHIYILLWSKGEIFKVWLRVKSLDPSSLQNHLSLEHKPNRQQIFFLTGENQNVPRLVYTSGVILILLFFWKAQRQTNTNMYPKARLEAFKDLSVSDFG